MNTVKYEMMLRPESLCHPVVYKKAISELIGYVEKVEKVFEAIDLMCSTINEDTDAPLDVLRAILKVQLLRSEADEI